MTIRQILTGVLAPVLLGHLALAAIVLPGDGELTGARLATGLAALLAVSTAGGYAAGRMSGRKS
ncbi:hypothetical protein ABTY20_22865 [Streptomyces sp. NPDC126497]|uniref:hypothetical protein n=1 Tax=Streptomyces sp. NPDC126497 TaxID=3155313 RepID=UPI00332B8A50